MLDQIPELSRRFTWLEVQAYSTHVEARQSDIEAVRDRWKGVCDLVHDIELLFRLSGYEPMLEAPTEELSPR